MVRQIGAQAVRDRVEPVVQAADLYLEDVTVTSAGKRSVVRITVDLPEDETGSLDLDSVADVSRSISTALDEADVFPGAYTLEVSSPGTSRPLVDRRHFMRARGLLVRLVLADGGTRLGRLTDVDESAVVLRGEQSQTVPFSDIVRGEVQVELTRDDSADVPSDDDGTTGPRTKEA